jgi:hypothetical protein
MTDDTDARHGHPALLDCIEDQIANAAEFDAAV